VLLEMFPKAKFVYLQRNPYVVYRSTVKLWNSFAHKHGLQDPKRPDLIQAKVLKEYRIVIESYERAKSRIPPGHLLELRYEDFTQDLVRSMERVYRELNLGDWTQAKAKIEENVRQRAGYTTNQFNIDAETKQLVDDHWGDLIVKKIQNMQIEI
jgi:hypothetical protein